MRNHFFVLFIAVLLLSCDIEEVNIPPEPEVSITAPTQTTQILDSTKIVIEASDDKGIAQVRLFIDGKLAPNGVLLYDPYEYYWNTRQYADSSTHELYAVAVDTDSNKTTSEKITITTYTFSPSDLTAEIVADTLIKLAWNDNSSKETGFQVLEITNDTGQTVYTLPPNTTSFDIPGIYYTSVHYTYQVRALMGTTRSKFSNSQTLWSVLAEPINVQILYTDDTRIDLKWGLRFQNRFEEQIQIEEKIGGGNYLLRATLPKNTDSTTLTGSYRVGTQYSYRLRSFSKYNSSIYSNTVTTSIPFPAPSLLKAEQGNPAGIRVYWKDNGWYEKGFAIERKLYDDATYTEVHRNDSGVTSWTDSNVDTTKFYSYRVRAFTDSNVSSYSNVVNVAYYSNYTIHDEFSGASSPITGMRFMPNSSLLVYTDSAGSVRYYNTASKSLLRSFQGHARGITALGMSEDGTIIATGGSDSSIKIWNTSTDALIRTMTGHQAAINDLHFNSGASSLASASGDSTVRLWNVAAGTTQSIFTQHTGSVNAVRFHPNDLAIASAGNDRVVRYWNVSGQSMIWQYSDFFANFSSLAFNRDGSQLACGRLGTNKNPLTVLLTSSGGDVALYPWLGVEINAIEFSPDKKTFAVASSSLNVVIWHTFKVGVSTDLVDHDSKVLEVTFNSANNLLASGAANGKIIVWSISDVWKEF